MNRFWDIQSDGFFYSCHLFRVGCMLPYYSSLESEHEFINGRDRCGPVCSWFTSLVIGINLDKFSIKKATHRSKISSFCFFFLL